MSDPITPSQAPDAPLGSASRVPPPPPEALRAIESTVARLRAELAGTQDKNRQARLLCEIGEIEEKAGDEPAAARDYLAAYNADPSFREPLEGLVRLLERRRSLKNLGRLVDALARAAQTPDEKARALLMKASYLEEVAGDLVAAKDAAREATLAEPPEAEAASAWLALEMLAAKQGDAVQREEALGERAKRAGDGAWRGLLLLDQAKLVADLGEVDRALEVLGVARTHAPVSFAAAEAIERLARNEPGLPGSDEAKTRLAARADALEALASAIHDAIEDRLRGDALGVPLWMRDLAVMADAFLRAADARRLQGNVGRAAQLLDRAMHIVKAAAQPLAPPPREVRPLADLDDESGEDEKTVAYPTDEQGDEKTIALASAEPPPAGPRIQPDSQSITAEKPAAQAEAVAAASAAPAEEEGPSSEGPTMSRPVRAPASTKPALVREVPALVEAALANGRIRVAELMGDTALAAELADARLAHEKDGGVAAALAMRVAEQAASEGDARRALEALSRAVEHDPACLPARALQLDLLSSGGDTSAFAAQLESFADHLGTDDARGRAFLLAAYGWAVSAGDVASAKAALSQAAMYGVPPGTVSRFARMMAAVRGDAVWYEDATRRLIASGAEERELVPLWVELLRSRAARGDAEGVAKAMRELGATPKGAWLGRVLEAFIPEKFDPEQTTARGEERRRAALEELAAIEPDPLIARGLSLLAAMRSHAAADLDGTQRRLADLAQKDAGDPLVTTYLTDLARSRGAHAAAAETASRAAEATRDPVYAAALQLEAGFERWRDGDRRGALAAFDEAHQGAPDAAKIVLGWASRGVAVDTVEGRRRALERAEEGGGDARLIALERFATEIGGGDPDDASGALRSLEAEAEGELAIAGALGRLVWSPGGADEDAIKTALARIGTLGKGAAPVAAAERVRFARDAGDAEQLAQAGRAWFEAGGGLASAVEWLAATLPLGNAKEERAARDAIARSLLGEAREQAYAAASLVHVAYGSDPTKVENGQPAPLAVGQSQAIRLANLELAPPGCDPRRRATALAEVDGALGEDGEIDALALAGWSALAANDTAGALAAFDKVTAHRPDDLASWEGLRSCAEATVDKARRARAAEELGRRVHDDARGAALLEEAALLHLEMGDKASAERAFDAGFARDAARPVTFDKLFRAVREKKEGDRLLAIIARRLDVSDDPQEIAKLFWEQARVLREKGDQDGALKALEHVTMLEPDHVGALALTGEIALKRGLFEDAANALSRLSMLEAAPPKNRVTAGVAAVDIFENKLNRFDKALEVLLGLHTARLSTLPVRERLARAAARTGSWKEATAILEELMHERAEHEGRIEAARLAMAIHRDRLNDAAGARAAIVKLLQESPADGEALDMLLATEHPREVRERLLARARETLLEALSARPTDLPSARRLAKVARAQGDESLQHVALCVVAVLGGGDANVERQIGELAARKSRVPTVAITEPIFRALLAPGDDGPLAQLFATLGPALAEALGPSLVACGVTKKDKVDPRSGIALRNEIATWAGAFGLREFDLYIGGKDPLGVQGVPGEVPSLVVGAGVNAPLAPLTRARVAREIFGIVRGTSIMRSRDEVTIAAIVVAACNLSEVKIDHPPYAILGEVERLLGKALPRKTRKFLPDICRAVVQSGQDARGFARRALASQNRVAAVASGDVGVVLADVFGDHDRLPMLVKGDLRAEELLRFVLSPTYLELRRSFGLEGGS